MKNTSLRSPFAGWLRALVQLWAMSLVTSCVQPVADPRGFVPTGGPVGFDCDPYLVYRGCNGPNVMECNESSKNWQILKTCISEMDCVETSINSTQHGAYCKADDEEGTSGTKDATGTKDTSDVAARLDPYALDAKAWTCIKAACASAWSTCTKSSDCANFIMCTQLCGGSCDGNKCPQPSANDTTWSTLMSCAAESSCMQGGNVGPQCGNGACDLGESPSNCPGDCESVCGNGTCEPGESVYTCIDDCPAKCGNGKCEPTETTANCVKDCPAKCGNGKCEPTETSANCLKDCPTKCGNGTCETGETLTNCKADCGPKCGNGTCETGETLTNCKADCGPKCGNGTCETGETLTNCKADCGPKCGNGKCETGETITNCKADCTPKCGNGKCETGETTKSCPSDCQTAAQCLDMQCSANEQTNCPWDCLPSTACLMDACSTQLSACAANSGCAQALQCMGNCGSSKSCTLACFSQAKDSNAQNLLINLSECGSSADCWNMLP